MYRTLPDRPNLTQLKNQAKDLLKAHARGDAGACQTLRLLHRFAHASDGEILEAALALHDVQFALALSYGFQSWNALKSHVLGASASTAARVVRDGGRVWIEGVPALAYGRSGATTYAGAMEAALAATPYPYTYDDIMGYTGLAFRARWYRRLDTAGWCPSCAVGEMGPEIRKTEAATGWRFELIHRMDREDPHMEDFSGQLIAAIETGFPVVGYSNHTVLDCAVAHGYDRRSDGIYFLWQGYDEPQSGWRHEKETGPQLLIPTRHEAPADRFASLRRAFTEDWRQHAESADNPAKGVQAECRYGAYALGTWAGDIEHYNDFTEPERNTLFFVSWFAYSTLICARAAAARFLNKQARAVEPAVADPLRAAATLYGETSAMARKAQQQGAFPLPFGPDAREKWTPRARQLEIETLQSVKGRDTLAERLLDQALEAMKTETPT